VAETDESNNVTARYAYLGSDYKPYSMTKYNEILGYSALTYYFQYNSRGDVTTLTDQWGTVVAKYTYDPWGSLLTITNGAGADVSDQPTHRANTNPIRYAGYRYDQESGLYYLLNRYYDSSTYRFLTKDPDGGDKDRPLSQNPYAYAEGNPVSNVDPEGEFIPALAGVGAVGATVTLPAWVVPVAVVTAVAGTAYLGWHYRHRIAGAARGWYLAKRTSKEKRQARPKNPSKPRKKKHIDPGKSTGRSHPQPRKSGRISR